jgi:hypothetical protein
MHANTSSCKKYNGWLYLKASARERGAFAKTATPTTPIDHEQINRVLSSEGILLLAEQESSRPIILHRMR